MPSDALLRTYSWIASGQFAEGYGQVPSGASGAPLVPRRPMRLVSRSLLTVAVGVGMATTPLATAAVATAPAATAPCVRHDDAVGARGPHARADGNEISTAQAAAMERELTAALAGKGLTRATATRSGGSLAAAAKPSAAFANTTVPVYVHIISDGTLGKVSDAQVHAQLKVLNSAYTGTGLSFKLVA